MAYLSTQETSAINKKSKNSSSRERKEEVAEV